MGDPVETVLRLVEDGRIGADEATELLAALDAGRRSDGAGPGRAHEPVDPASAGPSGRGEPRFVRVEITEEGRPVVNIRLPASIGDLAMARVPGLAEPDLSRIRAAIRDGLLGDLVRVSGEDGSGIRVSVE